MRLYNRTRQRVKFFRRVTVKECRIPRRYGKPLDTSRLYIRSFVRDTKEKNMGKPTLLRLTNHETGRVNVQLEAGIRTRTQGKIKPNVATSRSVCRPSVQYSAVRIDHVVLRTYHVVLRTYHACHQYDSKREWTDTDQHARMRGN